MSTSLHVDIKVSRRDGFALEVAFEAPPGVTILFGPSGSGKSTTLAAIAGLVAPDQGSIRLGDDVWFDAARGESRPIHLRGVAYVFQGLALFPHMTALRNVAYGIDRSVAREERLERAARMLERMKVAHLSSRKPPTFSGGEAQRVALARAFAMSPRLVLLDEPFSAMDRALRRGLAMDVRSVVDEAKLPLVHVTHHRNEARALGDRVVLLEAGRVKARGTVDEMLPALDEVDDIADSPVPSLRRKP
jgi:molybdate transport system ATP-binding protein